MKGGEVYQTLQHVLRVGKGIGYKQDPGQHRQKKCQRYTEPERGVHLALVPPGGDTYEESIDDSPDDESPACAMPETRYEKGYHGSHIIVSVFDAFTVYITEYIGTQETGKSHVPSLPVFLKILRLIRRIEVLGDPDVEHPAQPDSHICIAGQVKIIGNGIFNGVKPGLDNGKVGCHIVKESLGVRGKRIGDQHFLGAADGENKKSHRYIVKDQFVVFLVLKLRNHLCVMNDRSHDQLWEKGDEQQIIQNIITLGLSPEGIHKKGDELESKEGNTDGQYDVLQRYVGSGNKVHIFDKKVGVFVISQKPYICQDAGGEKETSLDAVFCSLQFAQCVSNDIVSNDASQEKWEEVRASRRIKVEGSQYEPDLRQIVVLEVLQEKIAAEGDRQEDQYKFVC